MQLDVFESDAEVMDAAARLAETILASSTAAHPAVAIAGGRGGRALMAALATRDGLPWGRVRFCVADESSAARGGEISNRQLLWDHVLVGRGVARGDDATCRPGDEWTAAFTAEVEAVAGPDGTFDVVLLELGSRGEIGALAPGSPALQEREAGIVRVGAERIGLGPRALRRARHVIVVAVGAQCSEALAAALRPSAGVELPAHLVLPSARTTWFVDRAAGAPLLRAAQVVRA
jgi:6-phosphogluconolactonase